MQRNFIDLKILFYLLLFACCFANGNIDTAGLSYIMEISLNEASTYWNYCLYGLARSISFALAIIFLLIGNIIWLPFIVVGVLMIIICIFLIIWLYESPRLSFEYSDYLSLSTFFTKTVQTNEIDRLYIDPSEVEESQLAIIEELKRNEEYQKEDIIKEVFTHLMCLGYMKTKKSIIKKIHKFEFAIVTRSDFLRNPFIMYHILMFDKHLRKNFLILLSLSFNISLLFYLVTSNLNLYYVFSREDMFTNNITFPIIITLTMCLSIYIYYIVMKYFGYIRLIYISFLFIFIFSTIIEVMAMFNLKVKDLNQFIYESPLYEYSVHRNWLNFYFSIIVYNTTSLYFILFFYIIQFSKTISRGMLIGVVKCVFNGTVILSSMLINNFNKSFFFITLASITGIVHTYFIYTDFDFSVISDFRKIEVENTDEKGDEKLNSPQAKTKKSSDNVVK